MSRKLSTQIVNHDEEMWNQTIRNAAELLERVENRAARLKGAIKTFTDLRDHKHPFSGPKSAEDI